MASRGSALQRAVWFFREGQIDEVRVAFQLVKEIVESRLSLAKLNAKAQATAIDRPRKARRTKQQMQDAQTPHQTTIQEQAGTVSV